MKVIITKSYCNFTAGMFLGLLAPVFWNYSKFLYLFFFAPMTICIYMIINFWDNSGNN